MSQQEGMFKDQNTTYETAIEELQQIIGGLESGEVGIDELTEKITRAKYLGTFCRERLRKTDEEVKKLLEEHEG